MKVIDILRKSDKTLFSFEIIPPLKGHTLNSIYNTIDMLLDYDPKFVNITHHRSETIYKKLDNGFLEKKIINKRPGTVAIAAAIQHKYQNKITVVPHVICGGFTAEDIENMLIDLNFLGIDNVLALRGDPVKTENRFIAEKDGHSFAFELVEQVANMNKGIYMDDELKNATKTNFSIGVAGYPEKHIEAPNEDTDLLHLKKKIDAGADYVVTQLFYDNSKYFRFVDFCRKNDIHIPIIPGIKPISTLKHLSILPSIFNIDIPQELVTEVKKCKNNSEVRQVGVEWAIKQGSELIANGVPAVHFYTMGKADNIQQIVKTIF